MFQDGEPITALIRKVTSSMSTLKADVFSNTLRFTFDRMLSVYVYAHILAIAFRFGGRCHRI